MTGDFLRRSVITAAISTATTIAICVGAAAGAAPAEDTVPYEVRHGESLYLIAERLLDDAQQWQRIARLNRLADPSRLHPGQRLLLPVSLLKGTVVPARVEYVRGPVRADGTSLRIGDPVAEGAELEVGAQGFVSLRLHDGSLLQLQSNSRTKLLRLRDVAQGPRRNTLIELDRGRIDATVAPQPPRSRFQVKTPLATAGVRGTRFGVSVITGASRTATDVLEGAVQVQAQDRAAPIQVTVAAGQGAIVGHAGAPLLKPLVSAPELPGLQERVERMPGPLPVRAVPGAERYRVDIADDDAFTRVLWSSEGPLPLVVDGLADGRYRLRARAIDGDGLQGAEAMGSLWVKTNPVPPLAQAPRPGEIVGPDRVEIACTEVPQVEGYLLELAANARFEPVLRQAQGADACRFQLDALPAGELFWRVASLSREPNGTLERGPFSDASRFVVAPLPVAPQPGDIVADGQQVHWSPMDGYRYRVQVASDTGFGTVLQDEEVSDGRLKLSLPPRCEPYALRLQAIDAYGRRSPFSQPRLLNTDASVCSSDGAPVQQTDGGRVQLGR